MNQSGVVSILIFMPLLLTAQVSEEHGAIALKPWPAPLYWQPNRGELSLEQGKPVANVQQPVSSLVFVGMTPCRIVDTRSGSGFTGAFGAPSLAGQATRTFPIQSSSNCAIPAIAQAYSFNVTVVPPGF